MKNAGSSGRRRHFGLLGGAVALSALMAVCGTSSCVHAASAAADRQPKARRALTSDVWGKEESSKHNLGFVARRLEDLWSGMWLEGRQGYKVTNDSRETFEPTPGPTKKPTRRQTPSPTQKPTRRPTPLPPTIPAAGTVYHYADDDEVPDRLPRCHGDCNKDDDCRSGLVCYQRSSDSPREVYGCEGRATGGKDYCVDPADVPAEPTPAPTAAPTAKPTAAPTRAPTKAPTRGPTKAPSLSPTAAPVVTQVPPIVNVPVDEIKEDDGDGDDLRTVNVTTPVPEFALGLTYPEEVVVNSVFQAIITEDLNDVMTGYLNQEIGAAISAEDGLVFEGVELTVTPSSSNRRRLRRALQDAASGGNVARFDIGGSANLQVETDAPDGEEQLDAETQQQIQEKVDSAVRTAVADEDSMMAYIRANASTNLLKALDGVEEPTFADDAGRGGNVASASDGGNNNDSNGTPIGQIVGFALVGVMAAGLLATGFVLYKRRQYRRSQEWEDSGHSFDDGNAKERGDFMSETTAGQDSEDPTARGSGNGVRRLIPFGGAKSKESGVDVTRDELASSSSEEEYDFEDGARDDDTFAMALQDAATTDKRAWEELDSLRSRAASMNKKVAPIPPPSGDAAHVQLEDGNNANGLAIATAAGLGAAGVAGVMARNSNESDCPPSGPPSESSGGWPAGDSATVASILAATDMPKDSAAATSNSADDESTALQEFQAVQQFVNSFDLNKIRVDDNEVPHSESKEDREFLQMGMQGFYADDRNPNTMDYVAAGAAVAGAGAMAARNGADPPADESIYEDDDTIGSSVMNSVSDVGLNDADADKRRIGITPYAEQKNYDSPRTNSRAAIEQLSFEQKPYATNEQQQEYTQQQERPEPDGDRLGISTYSEVQRREGRNSKPSFPQSKPDDVVGN